MNNFSYHKIKCFFLIIFLFILSKSYEIIGSNLLDKLTTEFETKLDSLGKQPNNELFKFRRYSENMDTLHLYHQYLGKYYAQNQSQLNQGIDTIQFTTEHPHPKMFIPKMKLEQVIDQVKEFGISKLIVDGYIRPQQIINLEELLDVEILDKSLLVLEIFER